MMSDDLYSVWKRRRSEVDVDNCFVDRVMERIDEHELPQPHGAVIVAERSPSRLAWRLPVAAAVVVVGLGVGFLRGSALIVFLLLSTSRGY